MKTHEFTIVASSLDPEMERHEDRFLKACCEDATLSFQKGVIIAEFARDAVSLTKAVASAYEDILNPDARVTSNSSLWDWLEAIEWLHTQPRIDREAAVEARIVREASQFLELHEGCLDNFKCRLEVLGAA